jgi:hypothetical protein
MLLSRLYALINPRAVKKGNEDVPGFHKTGFSRVPVWGWRVFGIALLVAAGFFLYLFLIHHPLCEYYEPHFRVNQARAVEWSDFLEPTEQLGGPSLSTYRSGGLD